MSLYATIFCETEKKYVGFEVLTAVVMKNSIFWNVTPSRKFFLPLVQATFLLGVFFDPLDGSDIFLRNIV
jgi:hypothetical protein